MSAKSATLAKSLHTVSVIVNVARREMLLAVHDDASIRPEHAISCALATLGYVGASDPYGLAAKALAVLKAESAKAAKNDGAGRTAGTWDGFSERPGYC
jgi:hypothetical protein